MKDVIHLSDFRFSPAEAAHQRRGLLGWVACQLNGKLGLDGLALRRTSDGTLAISFPARRDREGREHPYVRPLDSDARREVEEQIIEALRREHGRLL